MLGISGYFKQEGARTGWIDGTRERENREERKCVEKSARFGWALANVVFTEGN